MLKTKKVMAVLLAMMMVLSIGRLSAWANELQDTTSRGYHLIDGDVYDLQGNLLFKLYDGFTADGYTLDPNFTVHDSSSSSQMNQNGVTPQTTSIFEGTKYLYKNTDGNQGVQLGSDFTCNSSEPDVVCRYRSGEASGLNFAIYNVTRGSIIDWVSNIEKKESSDPIPVYNDSRPDDSYRVKASTVNVPGNATVKVVKEQNNYITDIIY